jgi:hypothetical protein
METADLHIHSSYSDSDLSIEEIFAQASKAEINTIAITDHDTVEGVYQAQEVSKKFGVEFIEGIELSSQYNDIEIHILGYFINPYHTKLLAALSNVKDLRRERLVEMAKKVNCLGGRIDIDELLSRINEKVATRLHLAFYMLETKQINSIWEAFRKYLSPGRPAYVARFKFSVKEAIAIIKEAEGLPFLAHPHFLPGEAWIKKIADWGLAGVEVVYPRYSSDLISHYTKIAEELGLLKSGGSDSHGSYKEFTSIGKIVVPYSWVEEMKNAKKLKIGS